MNTDEIFRVAAGITSQVIVCRLSSTVASEIGSATEIVKLSSQNLLHILRDHKDLDRLRTPTAAKGHSVRITRLGPQFLGRLLPTPVYRRAPLHRGNQIDCGKKRAVRYYVSQVRQAANCKHPLNEERELRTMTRNERAPSRARGRPPLKPKRVGPAREPHKMRPLAQENRKSGATAGRISPCRHLG